ncbi:hypothetical protein BDN72DRAFT_961339 [Pluteus cervinus]|uniref:Uncharacterized protein n=1 Tax=Pluteus cervinus TaxID=181527 RepID=A0ACD3AMZ0_9AGAR|nr:hypothetical protein BDN72DRAFT_961339 [Pluteus cervinus]
MPPEPTKTKLKRKSSRKEIEEYRFDATHARELELKRSRGEVIVPNVAGMAVQCDHRTSAELTFCAIRLKIKCDKQIPCQSCQRRGCAALCPNGSLATGQGTRFVLAATEHLHRRISALSGRVRQLEDALSSLQAKHYDEPHPLLKEDLVNPEDEEGLGGGDAMVVVAATAGGGGEGSTGIGPPTDVIDAFGTLAISDHGISRFFGPTGGSESLLIANLNLSSGSSNVAPDNIDAAASPAPSDPTNPLTLFSQSFPFTPLGKPTDIQHLIESHLPVWHRAQMLVDTYFEQVSWIFRGVTKPQVVEDMLPGIYKKPPPNASSENGGEDYTGPHNLALLFTIFSIGSLVQPTSTPSSSAPNSSQTSPSPPPTHPQAPLSINPSTSGSNSTPTLVTQAQANEEAEHYYQISRAALSLQPVLEKPSIVTIQTLHLMSIYNAMSGSDLRNETSMEMTWSLITLASHLSQTIGLHRDSARWGLSPKIVQRRRILFWDLFVADIWQSLNTGRPPSFSLAYIDCSFPQYDQEGFGSAFEVWQCRFAAECVADVTARTLTAEAPSYATILELDKKVRDFPMPEGFANLGSGGENVEEDLAISFQRCVLDHIRETVLMYIHRSFFAQAIIDSPVNPLKSAYAPSFLAAYRASSTILKSIREQFVIWPNTSARFWTMWTFAFSAAVVFGTVVTRGPRSPLASSAMSELEQACILFSKASVYSIRAAKALPILTKLLEKAKYTLANAAQNPEPSLNLSALADKSGLLWGVKQEDQHGTLAATSDQEDELAIFAGRTRFVSSNKKQGTSTNVGSNRGEVPAAPQAHKAQPYPTPMDTGAYDAEPPVQLQPTQSPPSQYSFITPQLSSSYCGDVAESSSNSGWAAQQQPQRTTNPVTIHSTLAPTQYSSQDYAMADRNPRPLVVGLSTSSSNSSTTVATPTSSGRGSAAGGPPLHYPYPMSVDRAPPPPPALQAEIYGHEWRRPSEGSVIEVDLRSRQLPPPEPVSHAHYNPVSYAQASSSHSHTRVQSQSHSQVVHDMPQSGGQTLSRRSSQRSLTGVAASSSAGYSYPAEAHQSIPAYSYPRPHHSQNPAHYPQLQGHVPPQHHQMQPMSQPQYIPSQSGFHQHEQQQRQQPTHLHQSGVPQGNVVQPYGYHVQTSELADLGLASRDSRLDERWSLFMADSGLLEGTNFRQD